ncbi:MAG: alpha/beta hydrolase [Flavobacteriaceae bacterium]|nr:alpha/beta hydrolase [Flavobacteriaceae bacterium]
MQYLKYLLIISLLIISCKNNKSIKEKVAQEDQEWVPEGAHLLNDIELAGGQIFRIDSFPSQFIRPRNVDVWLPDNYSKDKEYAVLYMHDGQNLFDANKTWNNQEWRVDEIFSELFLKDSIKNSIVVAIWNIPEIRHADYFPRKAYDFLNEKEKKYLADIAQKQEININEANLNADNYLKFIVNELKSYIDLNFSTLTDSQNTYIAGSSMGGLISMYAVCEYPDVFGGAACISTHWPGIMPVANNPVPSAFFKYMEAHIPSPGLHKFYFDYGTETLDQYYPQYLKDIDRIFNTKGYSIENYMNLEFEGADHSEDSWNRRFDIPVLFLLGKD